MQSHLPSKPIEETVRAVLGSDRVKSVICRELENDDGLRVLRVRVVYDGRQAITLEEMDEIVDDAWSQIGEPDVVPVFDFQADTDNEFLAAE